MRTLCYLCMLVLLLFPISAAATAQEIIPGSVAVAKGA